MPLSFLTEYKPIKEVFVFFKSIGWSWLLFTPLFLMKVGSPLVEKRHTMSRFIVQVTVALIIMLVSTSTVFYVGTKIFAAEIKIEMKNMAITLEEIKAAQAKQVIINGKKDLDFFTHKHSRKDGAVKLRGE